MGFLESHHEDADYVPGVGNIREGAWGFPGGGAFAFGTNPNSFLGPEGPWDGTRLSLQRH